MSGAALLGGLYGLVLGVYWAKALESAAARDTLLAPSLAAVESRFALRGRTNWFGEVVTYARRVEGDAIVGEVAVWFVPKDEKIRRRPRLVTGDDQSLVEPPGRTSSTGLTVQDGVDGTYAEFVISVSAGEGISVFPRRQLAKVPTDTRSERYLFKLLRQSALLTGSGSDVGPAAPTPHDASSILESKPMKGRAAELDVARPVLVDISMAGRTVQIIETHLLQPGE